MATSPDRTVHAVSADATVEVVRYDRAGKWALEHARTHERVKPGIANVMQAVATALRLHAEGGQIRFAQPGGAAFDRHVRRSLPTRNR